MGVKLLGRDILKLDALIHAAHNAALAEGAEYPEFNPYAVRWNTVVYLRHGDNGWWATVRVVGTFAGGVVSSGVFRCELQGVRAIGDLPIYGAGVNADSVRKLADEVRTNARRSQLQRQFLEVR